MPIDPWLSHLLLECALCYSFKEIKADLPTPKSEKTGGGLKKTFRLSKKPGDERNMPIDPWLSHLLLECALCYSFKEIKADLPTPKSEKTGGGLKKTFRLSKKPGDFAKTSPDLIIVQL